MSLKAYRYVTLCTLLAATGCQAPDTLLHHEATVKTRDEAAAILVSVNSVAPWDQVADALAPAFNLANGDAAASQVAPITARVQEQVLSAFNLSLGLGLSATPAKPAPPSPTTPPAPAAPATPAPTSLPSTAGVSGDIAIDPVLKYQAALALYQAVQLMNREVADAAVLTCTVPYVVQLKFAVIPYRHDLPYDVHARVGFFPDTSEPPSPHAPDTPKARGFAAIPSKDAQLPNAVTGAACDNATALPQIVPLLVTDDIERALKLRAVETAQQIGIALSAAYIGAGGSLGANSVKQGLGAISGQDINSRLTVTRLSDNTIYAKIGATNEATAEYALVGQTYNVALLLLVPRGFIDTYLSPPKAIPSIQLVIYTELRNTYDGSVLAERPPATLLAEADAAMDDVLVGNYQDLHAQWMALDSATRERIVRCLTSGIATSEYDRFEKALAAPCKPDNGPAPFAFSLRRLSPGYRISLWTRLSGLLASDSFKGAFFELPLRPDVIIPPQTAVVFDDTKDKAQIQLQNVTGAQSRTVTASLLLSAAPAGQAKRTYPLPAQSIAFDPGTRLLTLTFPSPVKWGITGIDWGASKLDIKPQRCSAESLCPNFLLPPVAIQVVYAKAAGAGPEVTASFSFESKATQIVADKGSGSVTVLLDKIAAGEAVSLTVSGASFKSAVDGAGKTLASADGPIAPITQTAAITFQFQDLYDGMSVTIQAEGKKGATSTGKKSLQFAVVGR